MSTLETTITAVTVLPDRARVTRTGTLTLDAGAQTVSIINLPRALDRASLRARGQGSARLGGVQLAQRFHETIPLAEAQAAQDKLQMLLDQDKIYADEMEAWQARLDVVKNIGAQGGDDFARSLARGKLSLDGLTNTLDYLSNSYEAASNALRDLTARRRALQKQIDAARQEVEKFSRAAARETFEAQLALQVIEAGPVTIELTYAVYGARWEPQYDARLADQKLEWNYLARVKQETGEDWNPPYALTLSTATLAAGLDKPELPPWHIDIYQPPQPRAMKARGPAPAMAAAPAAEMMMSAPAPQMLSETAQIESSGASVTYKISAPRAIPSDGAPHQVTIAALEFDANPAYFCAPKVDAHAFVRAQFKNTSDYLMLPGQVSLYHAQDFVGTRAIETIAPQQDAELFLGADERVRVERKEIQREVLKTGIIGNTASAALAYRITVENPALDTAKITVLDQIPVSQHPDIKVKLREANPKPDEQNEQGELGWKLELKKGETRKIEFGVTVEYPKEMRVVGL